MVFKVWCRLSGTFPSDNYMYVVSDAIKVRSYLDSTRCYACYSAAVFMHYVSAGDRTGQALFVNAGSHVFGRKVI